MTIEFDGQNNKLGTTTADSVTIKTNDTDVITVDSNQNVGVGTATPTNFGSNFKMLAVEGSDFGVVQSVSNSGSVTTEMMSSASLGFIGTRTNHPFVIRTNDTERMRIDSSGNLLVGMTSPINIYNLTNIQATNAKNGLGISTSSSSGTSYFAAFYVGTTSIGSIHTSDHSTVSYSSTSDYRLKENVTDLTGASDRLKQIPVHRFNFIASPDKTVDGFLAHEVSDIVPEAITGTKDEVDADGNPVYQGIDQSKLVPLLTASLKEAIAKIEELETRLEALENV